jgi:hypothetical protein
MFLVGPEPPAPYSLTPMSCLCSEGPYGEDQASLLPSQGRLFLHLSASINTLLGPPASNACVTSF